ncbi:MAG: VWA domain-containing protein [Solirubrobacteraceae bacterium]
MVDRAVSELAARMRASGARVGVGDVLLAHRSLAAVEPRDALLALRASLCSSRRDLARFDAALERCVNEEGALDALMKAASAVLPRAAMPALERVAVPVDEDPLPAAFSDEELLIDKDFAEYSEAERVAARTLLARLARRGPQRLSRRTRPARRGRPDPHATLRAATRHGNPTVLPRFRKPVPMERSSVLVVDVSGSMAPYARMLLMYAQAAVAARRRVEAFALGTRLTRITRELAGRDPDRALARATERVVDLGGGTRIGESLAELNRVHGRRIGRGAVVVILSDGWDRGEPEQVAAEMARLGRTAHRLVWLNPLAANPAYEPLTQGMRAALPHADDFLPGNSLASLAALADLMETIA